MFLYLVFFMFLFVAAAFGATYLCVRRTPFAPYSVLLSLVSFQPFLLICVTLLGYRKPVPLEPMYVFVPVLAGICLTVFVSLRHRIEIKEALDEGWRFSLLIFGLTLAAMALATPILIASRTLAYIDWWNGELANYAQFAHQFLGILHDPNYTAFFQENSAFRYGAELFLAALSVLTGKAPLMLVEVLSALYKVSAIVAFAVSLDLVRKECGLRLMAVVLADIGFAFAAILSLNHVLAFLAAQAVTGSFILLCLGLFTNGLYTRRVQALFAIHVLFIVITYSEALPLLFPVVALVFIEALWTRRKNLAGAILVVFGAGFLINPVLLASRVRFLYLLRLAVAGFNVLGSPKDNWLAYVAAAIGFQYPFADVPALPRALLLVVIPLALAAMICALCVASVRLRTLVFVGILILVVVTHLDFTTSVAAVSGLYYKNYKMIAAYYFTIFFTLAFLIDALLRRRPWNWRNTAPYAALFTGACVLIGGNMFITTRAVAAIKDVPSVYREPDVQHAFALTSQGGGPALILSDSNSAAIWDLMANYMGIPRVLLDRQQAAIVYHNASPVFIEPVLFPGVPGTPPATPPGPSFSGKMIIPQVAAYNLGPQPVNLLAILKAISPGLRLQEGKALLTTPAFRVIDGKLISTGNSEAAPDGLKNQPPTIVGVMPKFGKGANVTFAFTYSDPNGFSDVAVSLILIHGPTGYNDACYMSFGRAANQLGLVLDGGTAWDTTQVGSSKRLENKNCAIDAVHSSASGSGNEFTLNVALRFKPAFAGRKSVETTVADQSQLTTGWQAVGYWDVP